MDTALLNIAGVAILLMAEASGSEPPLHASSDGRELVRHAIEAPVAGFAAVVENVIAGFWSAHAPRIATAVDAARQIDAVATVLQQHPPSAAALTAATVEMCRDSGRCYARMAAIARLVDSIAAPALLDGSLDHAGLTVESARAMLTDLFAATLDSAASIAALGPALLDAVRTAAGNRPARDEAERWHDDAIAEHASRHAADLGLPSAMIDGLILAARRNGRLTPAIDASLDTLVIDAIETLDDLRRLADRPGDDETLEATLFDVIAELRDGRLDTADAMLTASLPALEAAARVARRDGAETARYAEALNARARLLRLASSLRQSANSFHRAALAWPSHDRLGRWRIRLAQARVLTELGQQRGVRSTVLAEAVQIYAEAGGIVSEGDCPVEWAEANIELGMLLLQLGQRECRPERYLAAALHFKPAVEVMTRERKLDGWARGQVGLADALRGQGAFQGDVVTLGDAAFAYRAALGILTRGMTPELWQHARAALGYTLVRTAEETGRPQTLQDAIELLLPVADLPDQPLASQTRTIVDLALGRALLLATELEEAKGTADDGGMLREALALIEAALAAPVEHLTALDRAAAQRARGTIEARLADGNGDAIRFQHAIEAKRRARDLYFAIELDVEAEQLDREIEAIEGAMRNAAEAKRASATPRSRAATAPIASHAAAFAG